MLRVYIKIKAKKREEINYLPKLFNVSACIAWGYLVITGSGLHFIELNILNGFKERPMGLCSFS